MALLNNTDLLMMNCRNGKIPIKFYYEKIKSLRQKKKYRSAVIAVGVLTTTKKNNIHFVHCHNKSNNNDNNNNTNKKQHKL